MKNRNRLCYLSAAAAAVFGALDVICFFISFKNSFGDRHPYSDPFCSAVFYVSPIICICAVAVFLYGSEKASPKRHILYALLTVIPKFLISLAAWAFLYEIAGIAVRFFDP